MAQSLRALKLAALADGLRTCPLLAGLSRESLLAVAGLAVLKAADSGEFLFHRGEAARDLNLVLVGSVVLCGEGKSDGDVDSDPIRFGRGELVDDSRVSDGVEYLCDAKAAEVSQILRVDRAGFEELLKKDPSVALGMIRSLNQRFRFWAARSGHWAVQDAEIRILNWLLRQRPASRSGKGYSVEIPGSRRRLAERLSIDLSALTNGLKRLGEGGCLEVQGLKFVVRDANALEVLLQQKLGGQGMVHDPESLS